jgi:hypothetical protein
MRARIFSVMTVAAATLLAVPTTAQAAWQMMNPFDSPNGGCASMKFFGDTSGFVYCDTKLFATSDGMSWGTGVPVPQLFNGALLPAGIEFLSAQTLILFGTSFNGATTFVAKSVDGGQNWTAKPFQTTTMGMPNVRGVRFADAQNGLAYGVIGQHYLLARTADGGETWTDVALPFLTASTTIVVAVAALGADTWIVAGSQLMGGNSMNLLERTTDAGANWTAGANTPNQGFQLIQFLDGMHGYGLGPIGNSTGLWSSADGGASWAMVTQIAGSMGLPQSMIWKDLMNGLLGTEFGILRTSDGGVTWTAETLPANWYQGGSMAPVGGLAWPGPSAYAFTAANVKTVLRNPTAGGSSPATGTGGTAGSSGAAGAAGGGMGGAPAGAGGDNTAGMGGTNVNGNGGMSANGNGGASAGGSRAGGGGGGCSVAGRGSSAAALALGVALTLLARRGRRQQAITRIRR